MLLKLLVSRLSTRKIWPTVSYSEMDLALLIFNNQEMMPCRGITPLKVTSGRLRPPGIVSSGLVEERTPIHSRSSVHLLENQQDGLHNHPERCVVP